MNADRLLAFRQRAQTVKEQIYPATIRIGEFATLSASTDNNLAASTGGLRHSDAGKLGGIESSDDIAFHVAKSIMPDMPDVGQRVIWVERGLFFLLTRVTDTGDSSATFRLACVALNQDDIDE